MRADFFRRANGFTLIELMVAVGLMVILIGAVVFVFAQTTGIFNEADARMQIYQNARLSIDKMEESLVSALPITDPNQYFILANMYTNSPELSGSCDDPTGCTYNQGDAMFFYGTTYVQGQPVTGYILYRMGDYDWESDSYRLKVYVIPLAGINQTAGASFGDLIDTDPDTYNPGGGASEIQSDELCQYVRAVRIKYNYTDAWPGEYDIAGLTPDSPTYPPSSLQPASLADPSFPEMMNLLPYPWTDGTGVNEAQSVANQYVGDKGDNDLNFGAGTASDYWQCINKMNCHRYLKRTESGMGLDGSGTPIAFDLGPINASGKEYPPFWFAVGDSPDVLIPKATVAELNSEYNNVSGDQIPKPMKWDDLFTLFNPGPPAELFPTFRWMPSGASFGALPANYRVTPDHETEPTGWNTKHMGACFLRFKVHDVDWESPTTPLTYCPDDEHPLGMDADSDGEPEYPGNAIRVKGSDFVDGSDHYLVKKLPSSIEVTMRVVDQFRFSTRIISKIVYLPVN